MLLVPSEIQRSLEVSRDLVFGEDTPGLNLYISFGFGTAKLDEVGRSQADELAKALLAMKNNAIAVLLVGHTDRHGTDVYNDALSTRRARTVVEYLIRSYSLPPDMLSFSGKGKRQPLATGTTEADDALNRRVELRVLQR